MGSDAGEGMSPRNRAAIDYANAVALEIVSDPERARVRDEINRLLTEEKLRSVDIARRLNGELCLRKGVSEATAASIIRRVLENDVDGETREAIQSERQANRMRIHQSTVSSARNEKMRELGMFVWEPMETEALRSLMSQEEFLLPVDRATKRKGVRLRDRHCNAELIAARLNVLFPDKHFTKLIVSRKVEYIRSVGRKAKKATASNRQTPQVPQYD